MRPQGLNHPHIVAVHDSGEHAGTPFIVMERLPGRTLADALVRGPLPQDQVRWILNDVLSALSAAHAAGILHRDIKPANILFTNSGDVKVADFGIAKSAGAPATMTGQIVGTMAYLSPDRLAGRPATVADDLYAVGAVGYEALSGRKPFPEESLPALARAIAEDTPPPLALLRPDVDPAAGRDGRTRDGARTAVAFSERRGDARRVIWCTAAEFGTTADAGAGCAAAASDDHGRRHAGPTEPHPHTACSRRRAGGDRTGSRAGPVRVGFAAVESATREHQHVIADPDDLRCSAATGPAVARANR